jgi:hypothetical protein
MHKTATTIILALLFTLCATAQTNTAKHSDATVNQMQGVYIFMYSKPTAEYTYLGSIKIKTAWSGQPEEMLNITLRKLKKDYPGADGIIFTSAQMEMIDVIKFK